MKKILTVIGIFFALLFVAILVLPVIFKDDIRKVVDQAIAENVNADVYYDQFSLSLIKNFPNATVSLSDFGVVNRAPFQGDTLLAVDEFNVSVDLKSVIFGDQPRISGIVLDQPNVYVQVMEDGTANYDIAIASEDTVVEETETTSEEVSFTIDHWEVNNANIVYQDLTMPMFMAIENMNHQGSGDFTLDVFDMETYSEIEKFTVNYDGVEYMTDKKLMADVTMNMNLEDFKFTFKENTVAVNDFALGFDGFFAMPDENMEMDITFGAKDNTFKSLLSLVPGVYLEGFEEVKTEGELDFNGFVRGTYNEESMPAFQLKLLTQNAMFQYPDLPTAVTNIDVDLLVDNADGNLDNTVVNLKSFHADLGNNPLDARLLLKGLDTYTIDTEVKAKLNLAELNQMFPIDSLDMRGIFNMNLLANGTYDSVKNIIPKIDMAMAMQQGYIKQADYPPLENISFTSTVKNTTGQLAQTTVRVNDFDMSLAGEPFKAQLLLTNLDDYTWDLKANGTIDLEKVMQIYPMEGMDLAGVIKANIQSKGKLSDVEAERYAQLQTSGSAKIQNFRYVADDFPQGFSINNADAQFNPERVTLASFEGAAGRSDMRMSGYVANYLAYALAENGTLRGQLDFKSGKMDLNEWMTEDGAEVSEDTSEVAMEVVEIPKNIDFVLNSSIAEVLYDNMTMNNMKGKITVRQGVVRMDGLNFGTLGGQFAMNGSYDTRDIQRPAFDFDLNIRDVAIKEAYNTFNTIQTLAPVAEKMEGDFSTKFKIAGLLGQDMSPLMNTLDGKGVIEIEDAALTESKLVGAITAVTKLSNTESVSLNDVEIQAEVRSGRVYVQPFDVNIGNFKTVIAGSNGIDGSIDYLMKMNVPAGTVGTAINSAIAKFTGNDETVSSNIILNLKVTGTADDPKVGLAGTEAGSGGSTAKAAVKAKVEKQAEELKGELEQQKKEAEAEVRRKAEQAKQEAAEAKRQAELRAKEEAEKAKEEVQEAVDEKKEEVKDEAKKKLKKLFPPK
uniref:AsmA-like C-terminal region-containing protein n=1 Tax=Roseihalotalea indica TaxID=2867963 RepID=A0AA49GS70_9BACT|nr:AsmA-like C-terminal region-containing protein [Tunicatimonas sp. TK19036]